MLQTIPGAVLFTNTDQTITICYIFSDQSDPFNRQPLTMEMIQPATELKEKMDAWLRERGIDL